MRTFFLSIALVAVLAPLQAHAQKRAGSFTGDNGQQIPYAYFLPDDFDANQSYPVLLAPGDEGSDTEPSFFWRVDNPSQFGWILVESPVVFEANRVSRTQQLMDHLRQQFKVEGDKFYIAGWSANSGPVFETPLALPDYFHGMIGIPGHPRTTSSETLAGLKNVHVLFIVGENDGYWLNQARSTHQRLQDLGVTSTLDIVKNGGHVLTELVGKGFLDRVDALRKRVNMP